jgi:hypothetical protein
MKKGLKLFSMIIVIVYYIVFAINVGVTSYTYNLDSSLDGFEPPLGSFEGQKYEVWDNHSANEVKEAKATCEKINKYENGCTFFGFGVILFSIITIITVVLYKVKGGKFTVFNAIAVGLAVVTLILNPLFFGPGGYYCEELLEHYESVGK